MPAPYVVDTLYVDLIERYAQAEGLERKDVVNLAFHEFFRAAAVSAGRGVMSDGTLCRGERMKPPKQPMPRNLPRIDWPNLTDEALEELRMLVEAERERRWFVRRPRSPVDDLYDSGRAPHPAHAEAFDTYYCRSHGTRRISRGELLQEERDETFVYVCTLCGQVADPTPLFSPAPVQARAGPGHITSVPVQGAE